VSVSGNEERSLSATRWPQYRAEDRGGKGTQSDSPVEARETFCGGKG
jgi:hypothetical protein